MTNPDNVGGLVWYVCTSCLLMVQLPSDTPTLGRCQCSPKGWSLRRAKLPKGYELCRAAPAGSGEVEEMAQRLEERAKWFRDGNDDATLLRTAAAILRKLSTAGSGEVGLRHWSVELMTDLIDYAESGKVAEPSWIPRMQSLLRKLQQGADGVDWRAHYRFQTAMRYMDNNDKMTLDRARRMADEDIVHMERAAMIAASQGQEGGHG